MKNEFTILIHEKGWSVKGFCEYWEISYRTYQRMCEQSDKHSKLKKMIKGVEYK